MGEFDLIAWIRQHSKSHPRVPLGIGDDCALIRPTPGHDILVTTDMLMEGRHFRLDEVTPEAVGYKALAVNLSDIAAMAGRPLAAVVAVALPRQDPGPIAFGLHAGMMPLAERFGVALAGGDTNAWDGPLVVSITMLGETNPSGAVRRSGAQPGDLILVTGPLGGSLPSGRHLRPEPRIELALELAKLAPIHAMIDVSDGLASDLGHILAESGDLGADLMSTSIPIHPDAFAAAASDGRSPLDHALRDGEDFELCLTVAPSTWERLAALNLVGNSLTVVGAVAAEPGIRLRSPDGTIVPVLGKGFDHLAAGPAPDRRV